MATPLINPLRVQGGTFYTFSSAVKDIQKTFSDDDARFVFSKFALLDIPDVATPSLNYENYVVWEGIGASAGGGTSSVPFLSYGLVPKTLVMYFGDVESKLHVKTLAPLVAPVTLISNSANGLTVIPVPLRIKDVFPVTSKVKVSLEYEPLDLNATTTISAFVPTVLIPNVFSADFLDSTSECLVLGHSMQFKQEYGSPLNQIVTLTTVAYLKT